MLYVLPLGQPYMNKQQPGPIRRKFVFFIFFFSPFRLWQNNYCLFVFLSPSLRNRTRGRCGIADVQRILQHATDCNGSFNLHWTLTDSSSCRPIISMCSIPLSYHATQHLSSIDHNPRISRPATPIIPSTLSSRTSVRGGVSYLAISPPFLWLSCRPFGDICSTILQLLGPIQV